MQKFAPLHRRPPSNQNSHIVLYLGRKNTPSGVLGASTRRRKIGNSRPFFASTEDPPSVISSAWCENENNPSRRCKTRYRPQPPQVPRARRRRGLSSLGCSQARL